MYGVVDPGLIIQGASALVGAGTGVGTSVGSGRIQSAIARGAATQAEREALWQQAMSSRQTLSAQRAAALSSALSPATEALIARRKQQTFIILGAFALLGGMFWLASR